MKVDTLLHNLITLSSDKSSSSKHSHLLPSSVALFATASLLYQARLSLTAASDLVVLLQEYNIAMALMSSAVLGCVCKAVQAVYDGLVIANRHYQAVCPEVGEVVDVDEAISRINTGDIALVHTKDYFSVGIQLITRCYWSHAVMFIRNPDPAIAQLYNLAQYTAKAKEHGITIPHEVDNVYVFESDTETVDGRVGGGVQLVPLRLWLAEAYKSCGSSLSMIIRPLNHKAPVDCSNLTPVMLDFVGLPYTSDNLQLVFTLCGLNFAEDLKSMFCSQVVTWCYKAIGALPSTVTANNTMPCQYDASHELCFSFSNGFSLGAPYRLM